MAGTLTAIGILVATGDALLFVGELTGLTWAASAMAIAGLVAGHRWRRSYNQNVSGWNGLSRRGVVAVACFAFVWSWSLGAYAFDLDTIHYHVVNAAHLWATGSMWNLPFAEPSSTSAASPGNGELLAAWMMPVTGDDTLSYTGGVVGLGLLAAGGRTLLSRLGGRSSALPWLLAALVTMPVFAQTQVRTLQGDALVTGCLVSAMAAGRVAAGYADDSARARVWLCLAGAALGIALGTKFSAIYNVVIVAAGIVVIQPWRLRALIAVTLSAAACSAWWYVRNWFLFGAPVPVSFAVSSREAQRNVAARTTLAHELLAGHWGNIATELRIMAIIVGPVAVIALAALLRSARDRRSDVRWVAVMAGFSLIAFAMLPYSAGGDPTNVPTVWGAVRFLFVPLALGLTCASVVLPSKILRAGVGLATAWSGWFIVNRMGWNGLPLTIGRTPATVLIISLGGCLLAGAVLGVDWAMRHIRSRHGGAFAGTVFITVVASLPAFLVPPLGDAPALASAFRMLGSDQGPTLIANVWDVRAVMGSDLRRPLSGIGDGPIGRQVAYDDADSFNAVVAQKTPVVVVVGTLHQPELANSLPSGWLPPSTWKLVGEIDGAEVFYVPGVT